MVAIRVGRAGAVVTGAVVVALIHVSFASGGMSAKRDAHLAVGPGGLVGVIVRHVDGCVV